MSDYRATRSFFHNNELAGRLREGGRAKPFQGRYKPRRQVNFPRSEPEAKSPSVGGASTRTSNKGRARRPPTRGRSPISPHLMKDVFMVTTSTVKADFLLLPLDQGHPHLAPRRPSSRQQLIHDTTNVCDHCHPPPSLLPVLSPAVSLDPFYLDHGVENRLSGAPNHLLPAVSSPEQGTGKRGVSVCVQVLRHGRSTL